MSLKKSAGNMYPWVTHTHAHLGGECPHRCSYCYVENPRFGRPAKYQGEPRLVEQEFKVSYGRGKVIFVENCSDLFAESIPEEFVLRVLRHCVEWPENTYVFQTKNPARLKAMLRSVRFPDAYMVGSTMETNRAEALARVSAAPPPVERFEAMREIRRPKFVTVEPVLDFDVDILAEWLVSMRTEGYGYFVNIGADSKGRGLEEPSADKVLSLVARLRGAGIEIRQKHNLDRLLLGRQGGSAYFKETLP